MCGRYTLTVQEQELAVEFDLAVGNGCNYTVRYNIAPTQNVPVGRLVDNQRRLRPLRWGQSPQASSRITSVAATRKSLVWPAFGSDGPRRMVRASSPTPS